MNPAVSWSRFEPESESLSEPCVSAGVHTAFSFCSSNPEASRQPPSSVASMTRPKPCPSCSCDAASRSRRQASLPYSAAAPSVGTWSGRGGMTLMMPCTALEPYRTLPGPRRTSTAAACSKLTSNSSLTLQVPTGRIGMASSSTSTEPQAPAPVSTGERSAVSDSWPLPRWIIAPAARLRSSAACVAPVSSTACDSMRVTLPACRSSATGLRVAVTTTCSSTAACAAGASRQPVRASSRIARLFGIIRHIIGARERPPCAPVLPSARPDEPPDVPFRGASSLPAGVLARGSGRARRKRPRRTRGRASASCCPAAARAGLRMSAYCTRSRSCASRWTPSRAPAWAPWSAASTPPA